MQSLAHGKSEIDVSYSILLIANAILAYQMRRFILILIYTKYINCTIAVTGAHICFHDT